MRLRILNSESSVGRPGAHFPLFLILFAALQQTHGGGENWFFEVGSFCLIPQALPAEWLRVTSPGSDYKLIGVEGLSGALWPGLGHCLLEDSWDWEGLRLHSELQCCRVISFTEIAWFKGFLLHSPWSAVFLGWVSKLCMSVVPVYLHKLHTYMCILYSALPLMWSPLVLD